MYDNLSFSVPESARKHFKHQPAAPGFRFINQTNSMPPINEVDQWIEEYENGPFWQHYMRQYYGMVKCIDDNIGKLMNTLKNKGIDDETIVVFTSDHGDTLMEHGRFNKNTPYETSAGIPFIIRYPEKVPAGKIIETAYSSVDFAPTILSLMGVHNPSGVSFQGVDGSQDLVSNKQLVKDGSQIVFSFATGNTPDWATAIRDGYKLVLHTEDIPWLFHLNNDPEEMINFIDSPWLQEIKHQLQDALVKALTDYNIGLATETPFIYLDKPACIDSKDVLPIIKTGKLCKDLGTSVNMIKCQKKKKVSNHCPFTCGTCSCEDSTGKFWYEGADFACNTISNNMCSVEKIKNFCRKTCNEC